MVPGLTNEAVVRAIDMPTMVPTAAILYPLADAPDVRPHAEIAMERDETVAAPT